MLKYDFALLVETFTETVPDSMFPSHESFVSPGVKVSDSIHGRLFGGVRKDLSEYVERINIETDNIIALRLSHRLLGTSTDCLLVGAYLPPENSPYYEETDIYNGVSVRRLPVRVGKVVRRHSIDYLW